MRLLLCKDQIQKAPYRLLKLPGPGFQGGGGFKLQADACEGMGEGWGMSQEVRFINSVSVDRLVSQI